VSTRLLAAQHGGALILTLESEDGYPRLDRDLMAALDSEIARVARSSNIVGAVITGSDRAFAAGADISEIAQLTPADAYEFSRLGQILFRVIERSPKPIVAAVRGYCMGGGLDLALASHERIAAPDAVFAHPGGALGILTGWGGTQRLPSLIGRASAAEILLTGRRVDAEEALERGLVTQIVSPNELLAEAVNRVREKAQLRHTKFA
jgi:enoyl-CoA hydratase